MHGFRFIEDYSIILVNILLRIDFRQGEIIWLLAFTVCNVEL